MIELKVQCDCGQKFKFDVEPVNNLMPFTVNCPICGADGTGKANGLLQTQVSAPPMVVAVAPVSVAVVPNTLRVSLAAPTATVPSVETATAEAPSAIDSAPATKRGTFSERSGAVSAAPIQGKPKKKPNFALGFVGALAGAIVGAVLFYLVFKLTGFRMGLMGVAVGFLTGLGGRLLGGEQEGNELGYIAGALAVAGIIGAQYFVAHSWWNEVSSMKPNFSYEAKVEEAKKVIVAVPTGSEQEIRAYLAKELSEQEDEKVSPSQVEATDVKQFKDSEFPQYQGLASGKITKADYEKQHAAEIAKEKEDQSSDEGTFNAVFVLVLLNRVSLVCMCAGAALAFKMCG